HFHEPFGFALHDWRKPVGTFEQILVGKTLTAGELGTSQIEQARREMNKRSRRFASDFNQFVARAGTLPRITSSIRGELPDLQSHGTGIVVGPFVIDQ